MSNTRKFSFTGNLRMKCDKFFGKHLSTSENSSAFSWLKLSDKKIIIADTFQYPNQT